MFIIKKKFKSRNITKALEINPNHLKTLNNLGNTFYKLII